MAFKGSLLLVEVRSDGDGDKANGATRPKPRLVIKPRLVMMSLRSE
jgi:hypothetical protein